MDYLATQGYVTLNLKEFKQFINGELDIPEKSVLITFDDGFKDNYTVAYPILKRHDFFASIFLITGLVASGDALYLSEDDIIAGADVFEYQSHTDALHEQTETGTPYLLTHDQREVESDLLTSINKLDGRKRAFAYPYGVYDQANLTALDNVGIDLAFTVVYKKADQEVNRLEIPRMGVYPDDGIEEFILKLK
nr:polysaccharide deacetylase family protein [Amphibacillus cookii]